MSQKHNKKGDCSYLLAIITIILILLVCVLFLYEFVIMEPDNPMKIPIIVLFVIFGVLVIWCYFATACSEPGKVPFYYGLTQDNIQSSRKYCIPCQNFKPERSHHCSTCGKCIKNMDHHCPWVNNCIGFHNRKYFILFIGYLAIGLIFIGIIGTVLFIKDVKEAFPQNNLKITVHLILRIVLILLGFFMGFVMTSFFAFHFNLVLKNTTTLQEMIKKNNDTKRKRMQELKDNNEHVQQGNIEQIPNYSIGKTQNLNQVFGQNKLYWLLPVAGKGPKGDGIYWPKLANSQYPSTDSSKNHQYSPIAKQ